MRVCVCMRVRACLYALLLYTVNNVLPNKIEFVIRIIIIFDFGDHTDFYVLPILLNIFREKNWVREREIKNVQNTFAKIVYYRVLFPAAQQSKDYFSNYKPEYSYLIRKLYRDAVTEFRKNPHAE